jgi:4-hydroxybutyryl-CoA dehydratase/vinylacetyl-CoA-Delta-isomerase
VRLVCQQTGCAQRYLTHDALNAIGQVTARIDDVRGTREQTGHFLEFLHRVQDQGCIAPGQPVMVDLPVPRKR